MGNVGREIARPFEYAAKTGSSETHEKGRNNVGGQITGCHSAVKLQSVDTILQTNFDNHLRVKGLPQSAVNFFQCLKYVQTGSRTEKTFELSRSNAQLELVAAAVHKINQSQVKIAIYWVNINVSFSTPKTQIHYVKRNYGPGWRNSHDFTN